MAQAKKPKAKRDPSDSVINFRVSADLKARIERAAASRAMSVSTFLKDAAIEEMNRRGL
jgi:uncharacterized protein (DUF1778 family)